MWAVWDGERAVLWECRTEDEARILWSQCRRRESFWGEVVNAVGEAVEQHVGEGVTNPWWYRERRKA